MSEETKEPKSVLKDFSKLMYQTILKRNRQETQPFRIFHGLTLGQV